MATWTFEPGHTAAAFAVRHMMVTWVRGHFKNVHGTLRFDLESPAESAIEAIIDAASLWTGEPDRDAHLKSADFLDVDHYPQITFRSRNVRRTGSHNLIVTGVLTIRGISRETVLDVDYLGTWQTPFWVDGADRGPVARAGFTARTVVNRDDFGVSWNSALDRGGMVVGNEVVITIDVEAIRDKS
jgi:polyisoprenoid-binding protein YceI